MQIDWWTLAVQTVNFVVLVWLLWRFLYRPVRDVIEKRKQLAEQAFADAEARKNEAEAARQRFEEKQAEFAGERQEMLKKIHEELEAERRKVLDEAKDEAEKLLQDARETIAGERKAAVAEIREQAAALAAELAANLLGEAGPGAPGETFLEALEYRLNDMPAEERDRLARDLAKDDARLTVVTAAPLTPEERDRWAARLGACLGRENKTDFVTDPEILGGAELRFPHAVLKFSWADQLKKAEELLRSDETAS